MVRCGTLRSVAVGCGLSRHVVANDIWAKTSRQWPFRSLDSYKSFRKEGFAYSGWTVLCGIFSNCTSLLHWGNLMLWDVKGQKYSYNLELTTELFMFIFPQFSFLHKIHHKDSVFHLVIILCQLLPGTISINGYILYIQAILSYFHSFCLLSKITKIVFSTWSSCSANFCHGQSPYPPSFASFPLCLPVNQW